MRKIWDRILGKDTRREDLLITLLVIVLPCLILMWGIVGFLMRL